MPARSSKSTNVLMLLFCMRSYRRVYNNTRRIFASSEISLLSIICCMLYVVIHPRVRFTHSYNQCGLTYSEVVVVILVTSQPLFQFTDLEKMRLRDTVAQCTDKSHMLGYVARQFSEFGIILHKALHIGNAFNIHVGFGLGLIFIHVLLDSGTQVTEVQVHGLFEEWILIRRQDNFLMTFIWANSILECCYKRWWWWYLELIPDIRNIGHVHSSMMNTNQFMHHSLISPLCQQRGHGIIPTIHNEENRWGIRSPKIEQLAFSLDLFL